jgi:hypothetical protein
MKEEKLPTPPLLLNHATILALQRLRVCVCVFRVCKQHCLTVCPSSHLSLRPSPSSSFDLLLTPLCVGRIGASEKGV